MMACVMRIISLSKTSALGMIVLIGVVITVSCDRCLGDDSNYDYHISSDLNVSIQVYVCECRYLVFRVHYVRRIPYVVPYILKCNWRKIVGPWISTGGWHNRNFSDGRFQARV